jgi:outer membrane surface antigen
MLAASLRRLGFGRAPTGLCVLSLAFAGGGCSYQLDSMFSKNKDAAKLDQTGALRPPPAKPALAEMPPENDLAVARAAASEVLSKGGKDTSMPWENPRTGARGTITPIASAYNLDGLTCRDFLASFVRNGTESWLQGEACQMQQGKWEVRTLKPWQRT